jgi:hypothetical protein
LARTPAKIWSTPRLPDAASVVVSTASSGPGSRPPQAAIPPRRSTT